MSTKIAKEKTKKKEQTAKERAKKKKQKTEEKERRRRQIEKEDKLLEKEMKSRLSNGLFELIGGNQKSYEEIALEIGISRQNLSKYMNGKGLPNSLTMRRIADYFGVPCDYLMARVDGITPVESEIINHIGLTRQAISKISDYKKDVNMANVLFGINQLLEKGNPEFFEALARYVRVPKVGKNDFANEWYYVLYLKYHLIKAEATDMSKDSRNALEAISVDEVIYHQVMREFIKIIDKAKHDEDTKKRYVRQIQESLKAEYEEAKLNYESPYEMDLLDVQFP